MLSVPINIQTWLDAHADKLKPPISNFCLWNEGFTVMVVGGPNSRADYHVNGTPEYFYQYKGPMTLKVIDEGEFKSIFIKENEMFLLPGIIILNQGKFLNILENIPHCPIRYENTVGIVIEQKRPEDSMDRLRWYCTDCKSIVYEEVFRCIDLGTQIKAVVEKYANNIDLRTCKSCGKINDIS